MDFRGGWSGCLALASLVVCGGCDGGGGGSGAGGGGEGGQGGSTSNLPVPEVIGEALELTGAGLDLVGEPLMGAGQAGFAVTWVRKISPYIEGQGVVVPANGSTPSVYFEAGSYSSPDVIRASEDGATFGVAWAADGGTYEGDAFWLSTVAAAGGTASYRLTDSTYLVESLDVAMVGGKWYLVTCLGGDMAGQIRIAKDLTSADDFKIDPLPLLLLPTAKDSACKQVRVARSGQELWGVYSAKVGSESAAFLQRFLPEPAGDPVMVSEPGTRPEDPRLFVHGSDLVVLYREDDAGEYAVRTFDAAGQAKGETAFLAGEGASETFDAELVGDHVVIATLGSEGVSVRSFGLDGAAVTAPLLVGPKAGYMATQPAIKAIGDVLGIAHYGDADDDGYSRVVLTRVGGL